MFERTNTPFQPITLQEIFEGNELQNSQEVRDLCQSERYTGDGKGVAYYTYNTRHNTDCLLKRPDITISLNLLKEITKKPVSLTYVGKNLQISLSEQRFNASVEELQNSDKHSLLAHTLEPQHLVTSSSVHQRPNIAILNVIRGQSFLGKLRKLNITHLEGARYTFDRLKNLELNLIDSKFDNSMVFKVQDIVTQGEVIIFLTNNYNWLKVRKIVSKIPELFESNIITETDEELKNNTIQLVKLLGSETNNNKAWVDQLTKILNNPKREEQKTLITIKNIVENTRKYRESSIEREISAKKSYILEYETKIRKNYENLRELEGQLLRLNEDTELEQAINEAVEYMRKSKLITEFRFSPEQKRLLVTVDAPIRYFDQEYAKALLLKNPSGGTYTQKDDGDIFTELLKETFLEEKYILFCSTHYEIEFYSRDELPINYRINRCSESDIKYLGQPHLNAYECLGNNKIEAQKACKDLDLLGLLTVFTTASQNFNLTDHAVFTTFRRNLLTDSQTARSKKSFLNKETGEFISFQEYYNDHIYQNESEKIKNLRIKYDKELRSNELNHLRKALRALGKIIAPPAIARQIAVAAYNDGSINLNNSARMAATYSNAREENRCIVLTVTPNPNEPAATPRLDAAPGELEYFELIKFYEENASGTLKDVYTNNIEPNLYTTLLEEYNNAEVGTNDEVPMPF